jgi:para-nitrobenzyl esterase
MKNISRRECIKGAIFGGAVLLAGKSLTWAAAETGPVAETLYGKVRGSSIQGVNIFRGIPYGGPAEGAGRFMPPVKPAKWNGVRDVNLYATDARSVQSPVNYALDPTIGKYFFGDKADGDKISKQTDSENCLVLNVLTPGLKGKRPVMVYMHGGGFGVGSGLLTLFGDPLVREQDVVLVGVNHRLNVFGYIYLGGLSDKYAVGNVGQLDLVAALEWVRDNIANFGGDPNNVTIFGESGGGAKVSALLAMPGAKGLFHKAVVQSGSALRASDRDAATATAKALLAKLGLTENQVDELQKIPADKLFAATQNSSVGTGPTSMLAGMQFGAIVDGRTIPQQTWDPKAPEISAGVPMIIGNDKDESTLFSMSDEELFRLDEAGLHARLIKAQVPENKVDQMIALYRKNHPKESMTDLWFRISTDRGARRNAAQQAELKCGQGKANVYVYYFQWNTPVLGGKLKAFHTSDLPLMVGVRYYPESVELSRQLGGAWASFARTGDPSQKGLAWPAYTLSQRATMVFDIDNSGAVNDPNGEERIFTRDIPSGNRL